MGEEILLEEVKNKDDESHYVNIFEYKELQQLDFFRAIIAEFLATVFFVGFSILGILSSQANFPNDPVATHIWVIVFHVFLTLLVIYAFSAISGAHFNPAVSIALVFTGRVTLIRAFFYVIAQLAGAITAAALVKGAVPSSEAGNLTTPQLAVGVTIGEGIAMEFIITFALLFIIFATAFDPRGWGKLSPFAIAFILGLNIHVASFVSGGAMNPARAFGPAVVSGVWKYQYVYWIGDMIGGIGGACMYQYLFMSRTLARPAVPSTGGDNHHFIHFRNVKLDLDVDLQDV